MYNEFNHNGKKVVEYDEELHNCSKNESMEPNKSIGSQSNTAKIEYAFKEVSSNLNLTPKCPRLVLSFLKFALN